MKKINVVWAMMIAVFVFVGCGACEWSGDPCDRLSSEDNLTDDERAERCPEDSAWYGHEPGTADDWPDDNVGVVDEAPSREEPPVVARERTFAIALQEFEEAERERTRCVKMWPFGFTSQKCEVFDGLLGKLYALEREFPTRTKEIAPHVARLVNEQKLNLQAKAATFERQLAKERFVLTTNYGRLEAEGRISAKTHVPRCGLGVDDFERYAGLLLAMRVLGIEVVPNRLALVQRQIGWQYEWPIVCEDDPSSDYEAAYKAYVAAESTEDAQRVAGKQWYGLVDEVCGETLYGNPDTGDMHEGPPDCNPAELDDPETRQWLKDARLPEAEQRQAIIAEAREAEQFGLPCEALDLASRAGDLERVRLLQQEHSHCVIEPAAPGGK